MSENITICDMRKSSVTSSLAWFRGVVARLRRATALRSRPGSAHSRRCAMEPRLGRGVAGWARPSFAAGSERRSFQGRTLAPVVGGGLPWQRAAAAFQESTRPLFPAGLQLVAFHDGFEPGAIQFRLGEKDREPLPVLVPPRLQHDGGEMLGA